MRQKESSKNGPQAMHLHPSFVHSSPNTWDSEASRDRQKDVHTHFLMTKYLRALPSVWSSSFIMNVWHVSSMPLSLCVNICNNAKPQNKQHFLNFQFNLNCQPTCILWNDKGLCLYNNYTCSSLNCTYQLYITSVPRIEQINFWQIQSVALA